MDAAQRMSFRLVPVNDGVFRPAATDRFFVWTSTAARPVPRNGSRARAAQADAQRFAGLPPAATLRLRALGDARSRPLEGVRGRPVRRERQVAAFKAEGVRGGGFVTVPQALAICLLGGMPRAH